jgi:hypothetical protein
LAVNIDTRVRLRMMQKWLWIFFLLVVFSWEPLESFGQRVSFETSMIDKDQMRIHLILEDNVYQQGVYPMFYQMEQGRYLTIGYEIKEVQNPNPYVDFDLRNSKEPLRIVLYGMGKDFPPRFTDVGNIYEEDYIKHLYDAKIVSGRQDGTFGPQEVVTRAEFITMVCRALKIAPIAKENSFPDMQGHWGEGFLLAGIDLGWISGYQDGNIMPNKEISLAEASVIIDKAFQLKAKRNGNYTKIRQGTWFSDSVKMMYDANILFEFESIYFENFDEDGYLNRGDIAMMISRAMTQNPVNV